MKLHMWTPRQLWMYEILKMIAPAAGIEIQVQGIREGADAERLFDQVADFMHGTGAQQYHEGGVTV